MKKSGLKDGMIVETKESRYLVMDGCLTDQYGYLELDEYTEDLELKDIWHECDIKKVYDKDWMGFGLAELLNIDNDITQRATLLWSREKEIDWEKVPKWTKVQVKDKGEYLEWRNAYFLKYIQEEKKEYDNGYPFLIALGKDDDFTGYKFPIYELFYKYCRIHPSVEIKEEWYK